MALVILRSRLKEELRKRNELKDATNSKTKEWNGGSQIHSYIFDPYKIIKDLCTDFEMGNVQPIIDDGEQDGFIKTYLMSEKEAEAK
jgi:peptide chain release factor 2